MERLGDEGFVALGGLAIGLAFGALAQRSRFCLRASTLETARFEPGPRLSVWLLAFSTALAVTQILILSGAFDTDSVRQLNNVGSLSGAIAGGLMFGCGMVLTRACVSRMLVLSATGNLRALLSGLVFCVVAQASLSGVLSPLSAMIGGLWTIEAEHRDLLSVSGVGREAGLAFALLWLCAGGALAWRNRISGWSALGGAGVGACVAAAWWFTYNAASWSFAPVNVHALSFTAPSADMLMAVLSPPADLVLSFDLALIPGVALGSFLAAAAARELALEGFRDGASMTRYILGGALMGFGGVLAGGCAVGAGVSGASIFALTAWIVLWSMWIGAVATDRIIDRARPASPTAAPARLSPAE